MGAIEIKKLKEDYRDVQALKGLDLAIEEGQVTVSVDRTERARQPR
jgi:ABC-type multidrug transport system ATPase subunit